MSVDAKYFVNHFGWLDSRSNVLDWMFSCVINNQCLKRLLQTRGGVGSHQTTKENIYWGDYSI